MTFKPRRAKDFKRTLVFRTKKGRSCSIVVEGVGSIDETDETSWDRPRAWDQKYG